MTTKRPWEKTIKEYLDGSIVGQSNPRFGGDLTMHTQSDETYAHRAVFPEAPDYIFHFDHSTRFKIMHAPTGKVAGTFATMFAYVDPEHRGKGLTAELYVALDELGIHRERWALTEASFGARKGAHRRHVERALKRGDPVPLDVIREYTRTPEGLRLREDYTPDACNIRADQYRRIQLHKKNLSYTRGLKQSFVPRAENDFERDFEVVKDYVCSDPTNQIAGLRLAAQSATAGGGEIRMVVGWKPGRKRHDDTPSGPKVSCIAFYAVVGDQAIDHLGVRPEADMIEELIAREVLEKEYFIAFDAYPTNIESHTFSNARECVQYMRDHKISTMSEYRSPQWVPWQTCCSHRELGIKTAVETAQKMVGLDMDSALKY